MKISRDFINDAKKTLPKKRDELEEELKKEGLSDEMIKLLFKLNKIDDFKNLINFGKAQLVAKTLLLWPKEIATKTGKTLEEVEEKLEDYFSDVLISVKKKKISEGDIKNVLGKLVEGVSFSDAVKIEKVDNGDIEERIMKIIKSKPGLAPNAYMGLVMKEFGRKIDGKKAMEIIGKYAK